MSELPKSPDDVRSALEDHGYLADDGLATAIFLAMVLHRPLFLEGEPGGGKTEVANALSRWTGGELVRLQCYEGIDVSQAVYEWDFARQLLHLRAAELQDTTGGRPEAVRIVEDELFSERFLVRRPLLRAIASSSERLAPPVLIIDEVDRADDEFEAFLLEVLADYSVTVPELGTFRAEEPPLVVLTSNRTRDVHDALKRRCLYHWVEHPDFEREVAIVRLKAPEVGDRLARQVTAAVQLVRGMGLYKAPGVAETIDWAQALAALGYSQLDETAVERTLGSILKYREDIERVEGADLATLAEEAARGVADRRNASTISLLVGFARTLRQAGVAVPVDSVVHYVRAIAAVGIDRHDRVYWAGRAVLIHRHEDVATYDRVFDSFWWSGSSSSESPLPSPDHSFVEVGVNDLDEPSTDGEPPRRRAWVSYSDVDQLRRKDFAACTPEELYEISRLLRETRVGAQQRSRRMRRSRRDHGRHDTRATMRQTLRSGGEVVHLMRREPSSRPRRVVLLCDVSGSMEPYARALLRFLHVAVAGQGQVEAFAVGTRLTRLTRQLSSRDPDAALSQAIERVLDWSGGTRLGEGIATFNNRFGMPGMARGAIVVILSDGLDRGDPALLEAEMARLHRAAHQTIWVNPLKASAGYEPLARGMAAALPHVDLFVEGHSAASLDALVSVIAATGDHGPPRSSQHKRSMSLAGDRSHGRSE